MLAWCCGLGFMRCWKSLLPFGSWSNDRLLVMLRVTNMHARHTSITWKLRLLCLGDTCQLTTRYQVIIIGFGGALLSFCARRRWSCSCSLLKSICLNSSFLWLQEQLFRISINQSGCGNGLTLGPSCLCKAIWCWCWYRYVVVCIIVPGYLRGIQKFAIMTDGTTCIRGRHAGDGLWQTMARALNIYCSGMATMKPLSYIWEWVWLGHIGTEPLCLPVMVGYYKAHTITGGQNSILEGKGTIIMRVWKWYVP